MIMVHKKSRNTKEPLDIIGVFAYLGIIKKRSGTMNTYLLYTETRNGRTIEDVAEYTRNEMEEIFTNEQRKALSSGETIRYGANVTYVDMMVAARKARAA